MLRFFSAGGAVPAGGPVPNLKIPIPNSPSPQSNALWGGSTIPPIGTKPVASSAPPFRTDVACQSNQIPDLNGPAADLGPTSPTPYP
jgi:hypothetical protein